MPKSPKGKPSSKPQTIEHYFKISIPNYTQKTQVVNSYVVYNIESQLTETSETIKVSRRFSEFLWLYNRVRIVPGIFISSFPEKVIMDNKLDTVCAARLQDFSILLTRLNKIKNSFINKELRKFITLSNEEFSLLMKSTPDLRPSLPTSSKSMFGLVVNKKPIESSEYLDFAKKQAESLALNLKELDAMSISDLDHVEDILPSDDVLKGEFFLAESKTNMENLQRDLIRVSGSLEDLFLGPSDCPMSAGGEEFRDNISAVSKYLADPVSAKEIEKRIKSGQIKFLSVLQAFKDGFEEMTEAVDSMNSELSFIANCSSEVNRLKDQYFELKLEYNKAEVLSKEYEGLVLATSSLAEKRKFEGTVTECKKFMRANKILIKVFEKNFSEEYELYDSNKHESIKTLNKHFQENMKGKIEKMIGDFKKLVKNESESNRAKEYLKVK